MWRREKNFLLLALEDGLVGARLRLLLADVNGAMEGIDFCLKLIEASNEIAVAPKRISVFSLRVFGAKQNIFVVSDDRVLRQALLVLQKYAYLNYKKQRLEIVFRDRANWAVKQLFLELLAEKTNAEFEKYSNHFRLNFRPAEQMSLWG